MSPERAIAMLDDQLAANGEDAVLRHMANGAVASTEAVRAFVRGSHDEKLVGAIEQGDRQAVLSPTGLQSAPRDGDKLVTGAGKVRNVEAAEEIRMGGIVVRYNLDLRG